MRYFFILLSFLILSGCEPITYTFPFPGKDFPGPGKDSPDFGKDYQYYNQIQSYKCDSGLYNLYSGYRDSPRRHHADGDLCIIINNEDTIIYKDSGNGYYGVYAIDTCNNYIKTELKNCELIKEENTERNYF